MADATIDSVSIEFEGNVDKLNSSLDNLITILDKLKASTSGSIGGLKKVSDATKNLEKNTKSLGKTNKDVNKVTTSLAKLGTKVALLKVLSNGIYKTTKASAELISTQTVFNSVFSSMDKMQEASQFVEDYTQKLYADEKVVKSAMSTFAQLTKNMGVNNEVSYIMSKNLTQLGYDLAATGIAGTDVNEAFTALKSGIGGEAEALKRYGVMLNQNTLQQTLYTNGINKKVSELNSAQKAELLYYQIMQSTTAQQGYAAQAMMQPANAIQILKTQFTSLTRAIGNLFIPILMKLLPYLIAATQMLQSLAQSIANFFNIKIDFSNSISTGIDNIQTGIDGIGDSADSTKKKVQNMLRDFDELHVINFDTDTSSGSGTGIGDGGSLGLPLQDYDAFSKMTNEFSDRIKKAKENLKSLLPIILAIGVGFGLWKIANLVKDFDDLFKALGKLDPVTQLIISFTLLVGGASAVYEGLKSIMDGELNLKSVTQVLLGTLAIFIGSLILLKALGKLKLIGDLGFKALLTKAGAVTIVIVAIIGFVVSMKKAFEDSTGSTKYLTIAIGSLAVAMGIATLAGSPLLAAILGIVGGVVILVKLFQELKRNLDKLFGRETKENVSRFSGSVTSSIEEIKKPFGIFNSVITGAINNISDTTKKAAISIDEDTGNISDSFGNTSIGVNDSISNVIEMLGKMTDSTDVNTSDVVDMLKEATTSIQTNTDNVVSGVDDSLNNKLPVVTDEASTKFENFNEKIQGIWQNSDIKIRDYSTGIQDSTKAISNPLEEVNNAVENKTNLMSANFRNLQTEAEKGSDGTIKALENIGNAKIKTPKFTWIQSAQAAVSSTLRAMLGALHLPIALPQLKLDWYATGGFPKKGELFVANENAPEMIGKMGNKNVVANNRQITAGISEGVYNAVYDAMSNFGGNGDTYVYVGTKQITDVITKKQKSDNDKYGR